MIIYDRITGETEETVYLNYGVHCAAEPTTKEGEARKKEATNLYPVLRGHELTRRNFRTEARKERQEYPPQADRYGDHGFNLKGLVPKLQLGNSSI